MLIIYDLLFDFYPACMTNWANIVFELACQYCQRCHANQGPMWYQCWNDNYKISGFDWHANITNVVVPTTAQCDTNVGTTIIKYRVLIGMPILPTLSCQLRPDVLSMFERQFLNIGFWLACQYCQRCHANQGPMWYQCWNVNYQI